MKRQDLDPLLDEVLRADELEACRQTTLAAGLEVLRRRRKHRKLVQACSVLLLAACGALILHSALQHISGASSEMARAPLTPENSSQDQTSGIRIITDEQLFALFPDRPLALIGKPGHQELVFLDEEDPAQIAFHK
jgi:hypothetical protein